MLLQASCLWQVCDRYPPYAPTPQLSDLGVCYLAKMCDTCRTGYGGLTCPPERSYCVAPLEVLSRGRTAGWVFSF